MSTESEALLWSETLPDAVPAACGANSTEKLAVSLPTRVMGKGEFGMLNPLPDMLAADIVTLALDDFPDFGSDKES
ncbi:MAG: hypothetical protein M1404_07175 [Acidobacteria bacterium]|nr:hypothetical protein [Acidobacteriota bacterium]